MLDNPQKNPVETQKRGYLPNFCDTEVFLRSLLVIELIAIVFALVSYSSGSFYIHIALISIFMLWAGLCIVTILCGLNRFQWMENVFTATTVAIVTTLLATLVITYLSLGIESTIKLGNRSQDLWYLFTRNAAVATILMGLALRYFYLEFESRLRLEVQAQARLQALQARIRPHFLFNSMNTIASLTHEQPDLAEQSIENLADLFRASLAAEASVSLQQELELTRSYIELESLRLGERLQVNWNIPSPQPQLSLPALTLQPLVENAIYHGIEPIFEGGSIDISVIESEHSILITVENPVLEDRSLQHRKGNQMAVDNIRERLNITYGGAASMQLSEVDERFTVTLKLPNRSGDSA